MSTGTNVTGIAYSHIKKLIEEETLFPGQKISPRTISEKLGFSNTPVTHALKKLSGEGLVEYRERIGFFVRKYSDAEIIELLELRAALESMAVRKLIENNIVKEINQVCNFWKQYKGTKERDYIAADGKFHEKIVRYSHNRRLIELWTNIGFKGKSNQNGLKNSMESSKNDHKKLVAAIEARDVKTAEKTMLEHFLNAAQNVKEKLFER